MMCLVLSARCHRQWHANQYSYPLLHCLVNGLSDCVACVRLHVSPFYRAFFFCDVSESRRTFSRSGCSGLIFKDSRFRTHIHHCPYAGIFYWGPYRFVVLVNTLGCSHKQYGNHQFCICIFHAVKRIWVAAFRPVYSSWCSTYARRPTISPSTDSLTSVMALHRARSAQTNRESLKALFCHISKNGLHLFDISALWRKL